MDTSERRGKGGVAQRKMELMIHAERKELHRERVMHTELERGEHVLPGVQREREAHTWRAFLSNREEPDQSRMMLAQILPDKCQEDVLGLISSN